MSRIPATLVLFETGPRAAATLADLAEGLGENRQAALCRELTKLHEEVSRGSLKMLAGAYADHEPRGEIVLVIAPPPEAVPMSAAETEICCARRWRACRSKMRSAKSPMPPACRGARSISAR